MAGSSCKGEQKTGDADERTVTVIRLSKIFKFFRNNVQNPEQSDGSEKDIGQKTTDAMV